MTYSERLNDIAVVQLNTDGFEHLSFRQKQLAYYLSEAGLWGKFIALEQCSEYNVPLIDNLIKVYKRLEENNELKKQIYESLFALFAHGGVYHSTTGEKLDLALNYDDLSKLENEIEEIKLIKEIWFGNKILNQQTVQKEGLDIVKNSGVNFYKNLTEDEVIEFRKTKYPKIETDEVPPYGFNERLIKNEGEIIREVICENGLYGNYVKNIIVNLKEAKNFVENEQQLKSIETLIKFYETGTAEDFDIHSVEWTKDKDGDIYFINGLIESYDDPFNIVCTFESIVAFKNPIQTAKVNKIIENIQWFEDNLPFDKKYKKEKAVGLSASSINVISMAGRTSPTLPLGINLPNSDWIRNKHGSKSVNLENVSSGRSSYEVQLRNELYLPKYQNIMEKYMNLTNSLHTDFHEIAGHGSGKILEDVNTDVLGTYYAIIEEARADLVALYYLGEEKIKDFGIVDSNIDMKEATLAQYVAYLTNGSISQLRRIKLGNDLTQAHFRNRQLISLWILENADKDKVKFIEKDGKHFIEINDINHLKEMFGKLLEKVQKIKSTGNFEDAKYLIENYGTKVNQNIHKEILNRVESLNMPQVVCFNTPMLKYKNNDIVIEQSNNFFEQQLDLFQNYNIKKYQNKIKLGK